MSIEVEFNRDKNFLRVTIIGLPSLQDFEAVLTQITTSNEYPPNINAVWDLRKADFMTADDKLFRHIIELRKCYPQRSHCKSALIANDDLAFGMSRMFQMLSEDKVPLELMVFRDYAEGEQWILNSHTP